MYDTRERIIPFIFDLDLSDQRHGQYYPLYDEIMYHPGDLHIPSLQLRVSMDLLLDLLSYDFFHGQVAHRYGSLGLY